MRRLPTMTKQDARDHVDPRRLEPSDPGAVDDHQAVNAGPLVDACRAAGVPRMLQMSALHADTSGPSRYQRSKGEAEALVAALNKKTGKEVWKVKVDEWKDGFSMTMAPLIANGVLVTENRSKGLRFTRVRMVIGVGKEGVVYKTADFHKPWDIGVTPDPAIQARINDLNSQLQPILANVIGASSRYVPRADACGNGPHGPSFDASLITRCRPRSRASSSAGLPGS